MSTDTSHTTRAPGARAAEPVRIRAHLRAVKKLGQWTTQRRLDVAGSRGNVVLDRIGMPLVPVGPPAPPLVTGVTPSAADVPRRAGGLVAARFDTVAAAAEGCDALVVTGVIPAGVRL